MIAPFRKTDDRAQHETQERAAREADGRQRAELGKRVSDDAAKQAQADKAVRDAEERQKAELAKRDAEQAARLEDERNKRLLLEAEKAKMKEEMMRMQATTNLRNEDLARQKSEAEKQKLETEKKKSRVEIPPAF